MAKYPVPATIGNTITDADTWTRFADWFNRTSYYNVRNPDFAGGAKGDGTTDDTAAIQACINASGTGDTIIFPAGTYLVSAPIVRKPNRHYIGLGGGWNDQVIIKVKNGSSTNFQATGGASGVFVPESWDTNATSPSGPVTIANITIDGNRTNNATGQHSGFLLGHGEFWSYYKNLYARECRQDGFRFPVLGKNGSSLMASGVSDIRCRDFIGVNNTGHGFYSQKSGGIFVTDVVMDGNQLYFNNDGSGIYVDEAAGFQLTGNVHLWQNGKHGLKFQDSSYACAIGPVYVEDIGRLGTSGEFLSGIEVKTFNGRSVRLHDCTVTVSVPLSGVTHRGIVINANDSDAHAWVHDNEVLAGGTATSAMYGFVFDSGSGSSRLTMHGRNNHARDFVTGQDKIYPGAATLVRDPEDRSDPELLNGLKGWAFDPAAGPGNQAGSQGTGRILVVKVPLAKPSLITNIILEIFTTAGATLTSGQNLACLYDSTGAKIANTTTADQSTNWTTTGVKTMAVTGGPTLVSPGTAGWVWVAILTVGTTIPTWRRANNGATISNIGTTATTKRFALDASTGNTALPANLTPSTMTNFEGVWAGLS